MLRFRFSTRLLFPLLILGAAPPALAAAAATASLIGSTVDEAAEKLDLEAQLRAAGRRR